MYDEEGGSSYTAPSLAHSISPRCVGRVLNETMFSLARALFSPGSAEDCSSLFVWFIDSMARSDSSRACASALWLWAFADRPRSLAGRGAPEVSRFSCMLFLSVNLPSPVTALVRHVPGPRAGFLPSQMKSV